MEPIIPPEFTDQIELCESRIGYQFQDRGLLLAALTHASGAQHRLASNERLEFLGDAILGAVVCEMLYHQYPNQLEGSLTKIKSVVVSRQTCARVTERLKLGECLIVGKGMAANRSVPRSLLADVYESLVAAMYLDGGDDVVRNFIHSSMQPEIERAVGGGVDDNFKSALQQLVQRDYGATPTYQLLEEKGPDHNKCFRVAARFNGREYESAWGQSKKEAEQ
ncbi:MAG: ribonuclease III [Planctomycetales bacterium]|nr:ribonuclease III [Planctomycetales bacterium]